VYAGQLTGDLLEDFKVWGLPRDMKSTTRAHAIVKARCFLRVAYRRKWISEPLVEQTTPLKAVYAQKEPYSDEEVTKILDEALNLNGATHAYAKYPATFRLLLELMLATGMRVGDAILFDPQRLVWGESLWIYSYQPQKQKRNKKPKTIEAFIGDKLKQAICECRWLSPQLPFCYGHFKSSWYLGNQVYERMQAIGERCGVPDCRPHRLRDTFAVRCLLNGMHLKDVSGPLGHSSVKVTETYYARWTTSRKTRLARLVAESLVNAPGS
jgi:integrase